MSGFAGVVRLDGAPASLHVQALANATAHRGHDAHGDWTEGPVALVHALLRTTPEDTRQPFVDDDLVVVADARIDNRAELHARDESDAAVIAAAYRRWGVECARHLEGDFAFAIWDRRTRTLFCARDAFGVKPFVYAFVPGKVFAFGSETRAVLAVSDVPRALDEQRIADYLAVWFEDHERTFHRAVKRLPGGHSLTLRDGAMHIERYWSLRGVRPLRLRGGDAAYAEGYLEHFTRAVRARMRVTRPSELGSMLSGGLDSTSIACFARNEVAAAGNAPLPVLTWIFSDAKEADEREFQEAVVAEGGMRRMILDISQGERHLWEDLDSVFLDGPPESVNYYLNTRAAKLANSVGVRTLLDGLGGDAAISRGGARFVELFLRGRPITMARELRALAARRGTKESLLHLFLANVASPLSPVALRNVVRRMRGKAGNDPALALLSPRMRRLTAAAHPTTPRFFSVREEHLVQLESPIVAAGLELFDRMLAHFGVEGRYPFFDARLAEYCLSLPADQKLADGYSRIVARRAMAGILPDVVRWRAGKGAPGLHIMHAMRASREELDDILVRDPSVLEPYVDMDVVRATYAELRDGRRVSLIAMIRLWSVAALGRWLRIAAK
jgi:asparagine synthase (glutamine-hydrolysing)